MLVSWLVVPKAKPEQWRGTSLIRKGGDVRLLEEVQPGQQQSE